MNELTKEQADSLMDRLAEPFDPSEVKSKPSVVSGSRAMAIFYVDARVIQDRLDDVVGVAGWQDEYECLPDGNVVCRLRIKVGDEWIQKVDVGGPSEQPDEGDRRKAAFSDALKRAAVKFGLGRYLYRIAPQWVDYDAQKKRFAKPPELPASARPTPRPANKSAPPPSRAANGLQAAPSSAKPADKNLPANGAELLGRLTTYDARLAAQGLCKQGELVKHISKSGVKAGYPSEIANWSGPAINFAVEETKAFEILCRAKLASPTDDSDNPPDPSEVIGKSEVAEVISWLCTARRQWKECQQHLGLPKEASIDDLTFGQYEQLQTLLSPEPAPTK